MALLSEALDALGSGPGAGALRLRVMASLARALAWHGLDLPRARALAAQAVAAARAGGDPLTLASCLLAQHHAIWVAGTARDRLGIAAEVAGLGERSGEQEVLLEGRLLAATDRLELADPGFRAELDEFLRLAEASRQPRFRYAALVRRAALALLAGRLAEAERLIGQAEMLGEECGEPGARDVRYDQGWDLLTARGRLGEQGGALPEMFPDPESAQARGSRTLILLASGARSEAAEVIAPLLDAGSETTPPDRQRLLGLTYAAELSAAFGAVPVAEQVYTALLPFEDETVVSGAAVTFKGAVAYYLGLLAAVAWPAARFDEFRRDVEGNFLCTLDAVGLGERIRAGRRAERFRGTPDLPSYLRQPCDPGWALVGDVGLLLDPITGQGISHAFRDAELLACWPARSRCASSCRRAPWCDWSARAGSPG